MDKIKEWIAAKNPGLGRDLHDQEDLIERRFLAPSSVGMTP